MVCAAALTATSSSRLLYTLLLSLLFTKALLWPSALTWFLHDARTLHNVAPYLLLDTSCRAQEFYPVESEYEGY